MVGGVLCPQCQALLRQHGLHQDALNAVERILDLVRAEAIGRPSRVKHNQAFIIMRYSNDDDNSNSYKYGILPGLDQCGIKPIVAGEKNKSRQILDFVKEEIKECQFTIAILDENNLNVYFEIGLAMGMEKEFILICRDEIINTVPVDLKNWPCLTYRNGEYEKLKSEVIKHFTKTLKN